MERRGEERGIKWELRGSFNSDADVIDSYSTKKAAEMWEKIYRDSKGEGYFKPEFLPVKVWYIVKVNIDSGKDLETYEL